MARRAYSTVCEIIVFSAPEPIIDIDIHTPYWKIRADLDKKSHLSKIGCLIPQRAWCFPRDRSTAMRKPIAAALTLCVALSLFLAAWMALADTPAATRNQED